MSVLARQSAAPSAPAKALPFGALRTVEAACRHRSFTVAARELFITHSAVSQAIRRLEAELGTVLFERRGTAIEPSEAALALAASYRAAASSLHQALKCAADDQAAPVVISTPAAMGRWWLGRRLADLTRAFPETRFEIRTGKASADVSEADLVVHVGEPAGAPESGLDRRVLFDVPIYPVCAPGLLSGLPDERDLSTLPRIENLSVPWSLLFDELDDTGVALVVDDAELAVQAALDGAGVALAHDLLVRDLIADGRLAAPAAGLRRPTLCSVAWRSEHRRKDLLTAVAGWLAGDAPATSGVEGRRRA